MKNELDVEKDVEKREEGGKLIKNVSLRRRGRGKQGDAGCASEELFHFSFPSLARRGGGGGGGGRGRSRRRRARVREPGGGDKTSRRGRKKGFRARSTSP